MILSIDLETRSPLNLSSTNVYVYAEHKHTDIWCAAFALDDEEPRIWLPGDPVPEDVIAHVQEGGGIRAWNASFERVFWNTVLGPRYGWPEAALEQFYCTMTEAMVMGLPRALGAAAKVLGAAEKDDAGRKLMLKMARPKGRPTSAPYRWNDDPEDLEALCAYCRQDVRAERSIASKIRRLSKIEQERYWRTQRINDRGFLIDLRLVQSLRALVDEGSARAAEELRALTEAEVDSPSQRDRLLQWVNAHGVGLVDLKKDTIRDFLDEQGDDLPEQVRRVIEIRAEAAKTSTAKLGAMVRHINKTNHRARGQLLHYGAQGTGRNAGRGIQPQNFPRGEIKEVERHFRTARRAASRPVMAYDVIEMEDPVMAVVASLLRRCIVAEPGTRFLSADFSQIEARIVAWYAGQDDLLQAFAEGAPIYEDMAAVLYGVPVEQIKNPSEQRTVGKETVLGAGFQMGADKHAAQLQVKTGIVLDRGARDEKGKLLPGEVDEAARNIQGYRTRYAEVPKLWRALEDAVWAAVRDPGSTHSAGVHGQVSYTLRNQILWCVLPSGRALAYPLPRIKRVKVPWEDDEGRPVTRMAVTHMVWKSGRWIRRALYGGLLTENIVQAMARDLLMEASERAEDAGYPEVLNVHDEILCEVPEGHGSLEEYLDIMTEVPDWAAGLPVAAEGWEGTRYRKG